MTVLMKQDIKKRLYSKNKSEKLIVTPIVNDAQIGLGTLDLRLGTRFIIFKDRRIRSINLDISCENDVQSYQEEFVYPFGKEFILQPNQFILGCTLEYLKLPGDLIGYVVGRSSWGRLGLIIETAPIVQPCFTGVLTLELINMGKAPITLYPGCRIAQISFHSNKEAKNIDCIKKVIKRKYSLSVGPQFSKIFDDKEMIEYKKRFS